VACKTKHPGPQFPKHDGSPGQLDPKHGMLGWLAEIQREGRVDAPPQQTAVRSRQSGFNDETEARAAEILLGNEAASSWGRTYRRKWIS
jgi:hypothetical protein